MDIARKVYKPAKIHRKVKLGKCYKRLQPAKLVEKLTNFFRMLFPPAAPIQQGLREEDLAFMTFIFKVNASKPGWQKAIISLLKNCKGARFKMDQDGVVEVSGITNPNRLLKKISKSSRVELRWFQFGQCSSNLFMPESKKEIKKDPPPPPLLQEKPNYYDQYPPYNNYNNNSLPPFYGDYGYHHYQLPQVFKPYAPY